jgi:large subunit ribosomal protein L9
MAKVKVILLESIKNIGKAGQIVQVPAGFFRNFLFKAQKARYATQENIDLLEKEHQMIQEKDLKRQKEAQDLSEKLQGYTLSVVREASEMGVLYGSVSAHDIARMLSDVGFPVLRSVIQLADPIKNLGQYGITLDLHPEVSVNITLDVKRN